MYKATSELFSEASDARAWESCDCERNVKEERVFHLDSFGVRGDVKPPAAAGGNSSSSGSDGASGSSSGSGSNNSSGGSGFLSASFKFIGPAFATESEPALRAAVQVLERNPEPRCTAGPLHIRMYLQPPLLGPAFWQPVLRSHRR